MLRVDRWDNINMDINKIRTGFDRVGSSVRSRDEFNLLAPEFYI